MKNGKRMLACLLMLAMMLSLLTACGGDGGGSAGGSNPPSASSGSSSGTGNEDDTEKPKPPAAPTTWAESRTNAYFSSLGVARDNLYAEITISVGSQATSIAIASKGKRITMGKIDENGHYEISQYLDESGNAYSFDSVDQEKRVRKYAAGTEDAASYAAIIRGTAYGYLMIPTASEIATMEVGEYQGLYRESFRINSAEAGTGTYEYIFDGDELQFILWGGQYKTTITTLAANPTEEQVGFPDWYSEDIAASRTSQYFKAKGMTANNLYVDMDLIGYGQGHYICTVKGKEAYFARTDIGSNRIESGYYIDKQGATYSFAAWSHEYYKDTEENSDQENYIRTAGGYFMIPTVENSYWYSRDTYTDNGTTYYVETFQTGTANYSDDTYRYVFKGNEMLYMGHIGADIRINKMSGTPDDSLLKIPDGYTDGSQKNA